MKDEKKTQIIRWLATNLEMEALLDSDHDAVSWGDQEGILISVNDAKEILRFLKSPNQVLDEAIEKIKEINPTSTNVKKQVIEILTNLKKGEENG